MLSDLKTLEFAAIHSFLKKFIYFWLNWVFVAVSGLLTAVASLVAEHGL